MGFTPDGSRTGRSGTHDDVSRLSDFRRSLEDYHYLVSPYYGLITTAGAIGGGLGLGLLWLLWLLVQLVLGVDPVPVRTSPSSMLAVVLMLAAVMPCVLAGTVPIIWLLTRNLIHHGHLSADEAHALVWRFRYPRHWLGERRRDHRGRYRDW